MRDKALKDGFKKLFIDYLVVQVETTLSIGIIGSLFAPEMTIKFYYFFLPALLGFVCMIPCIVECFFPSLSVKHMRTLRVFELLLLEVVVYAIIYLIFGNSVGKVVYLACVVSTLVLDVASYAISDRLDKKEVDDLNDLLMNLRNNEEDDDEGDFLVIN